MVTSRVRCHQMRVARRLFHKCPDNKAFGFSDDRPKSITTLRFLDDGCSQMFIVVHSITDNPRSSQNQCIRKAAQAELLVVEYVEVASHIPLKSCGYGHSGSNLNPMLSRNRDYTASCDQENEELINTV